MEKKKIIYIICFIIYLIVVFVTEIFYRNKLYDISVDYEEKIKQTGALNKFYFFWSSIFIYLVLGLGTIVVLILYPYNVFLSYVTIEVTLYFIMCLFKSVYANSRPYWNIYYEKYKNTNYSSKPTECDGEFGNPSGHSLLSIATLFLWYLFANSNLLKNNKCKLFIKYCSLLLVIICILSVMFSRIHRQIHSFNQVLFGGLLGLAVFFAFCYIIEFDKIEPNYFFSIINKIKFFIIPLLCILFTVSVILGYTNHNKNEEKYRPALQYFCKFNKKPIFGKSTAYHSGILFILIGGYLGILFLIYKINKNYEKNERMFYNWNEEEKLKTLKITLFSFVLPAIPLIVIFVFPYKYFTIKFILEVFIYFWYGFGAFGLCFYYGCVIFNNKKNNNDIHDNSDNNDKVVIISPSK